MDCGSYRILGLKMEFPLEMSPQDIVSLQQKGEKLVVIDVREPQEFAAASIEGSQLVPMQTVPSQLDSLKALASEKALAVLCHHGMRSLNVTRWLRQQGVKGCFSISGGIDRWSREIDTNVPRY